MPGRVYTVELDPILKALLEKDVHVSLIDPPSFSQLEVREKTIPWFTPDTSVPKEEMPVKKSAKEETAETN